MKKRTLVVIVILVIAAIFCGVGVKYVADRTEKNMQELFYMPVPEITTTEVEESVTEVEETTKTIKLERTPEYEDPSLYRKVELVYSEIPFELAFPAAVGDVKMYIPTEVRGEDLVCDNTYIVVEHHRNSEVILKLNKADGIITGNIVPMEEMINANLTFVYFDGEYSQDYTFDRDGDIIILKDFPTNVEEIHIRNRSTNSIYSGEISGKNVYVNDIIIKIVD